MTVPVPAAAAAVAELARLTKQLMSEIGELSPLLDRLELPEAVQNPIIWHAVELATTASRIEAVVQSLERAVSA